MKNKAIEAANLDDLLFQDRNKGYGAYELRRHYDRRLTAALCVAVSFFIVLILLLGRLPGTSALRINIIPTVPGGKIIDVLKPPVFPKEPNTEPRKEMQHTLATNIRLSDTENDTMKKNNNEMIASQHASLGSLFGNENTDGKFSIDGSFTIRKPIEIKKQEFDPFPDQEAEYPGGMSAYENYLKSNIKYPTFAVENHIQGRISLCLKIDEDGNVAEVKVLRGIGGGCDDEAMRVLRSMPQWKPGKKNGHFIPVLKYVSVVMELR